MEISLKKTNKLGIKLPYDPAILLLGIYPAKITILKDIYTPVFISERIFFLKVTRNANNERKD